MIAKPYAFYKESIPFKFGEEILPQKIHYEKYSKHWNCFRK